MAKAGKQDTKAAGSSDAKDINKKGENKQRAYNIIRGGIRTATELFEAVDATAAALFNEEITARDANSFFTSQRVKLSTVQTAHRIAQAMDKPLFDHRISQTPANVEQK